MTDQQYVSLVAQGGTPVRLVDQRNAPYPTTGSGALVFQNGATLRNVTLENPAYIGNLAIAQTVASLAALKALIAIPDYVSTRYRTTAGDGGGGSWAFITGNQSANVALDPQSGVWAAPDWRSDGTLGAWKRLYDGISLNPAWWGASGGATTFDDSGPDDTVGLQYACTYANATSQTLDGQGRTYRITGPLSPWAFMAQNFTINMRQMRTFSVPTTGSLSRMYALVAVGTDPFASGYTTTTLSSPATRNDSSITVVNAQSLGLTINSLVLLWENDPWGNVTAKKSEFAVVFSVVGNVITFKQPIMSSYTTACTVRKCGNEKNYQKNIRLVGQPVAALPSNPISTISGSNVITVSQPGHNWQVGNRVILQGLTAVGGFTTTQLNESFGTSGPIVASVTPTTFTVTLSGTPASSTATGGGDVGAVFIDQYGGTFWWMRESTWTDIDCESVNHSGFGIAACYKAVCNGGRASNAKGFGGYGFAITGVQYAIFDSMMGDDLRHLITHNAGLQGIPVGMTNHGVLTGTNMRDATLDFHPGIRVAGWDCVNHSGSPELEDIGDAVVVQGSRIQANRINVLTNGRSALTVQPYGDGDGVEGYIYVGSITQRNEIVTSGGAFSFDDQTADGAWPGTRVIQIDHIDSIAYGGVLIRAEYHEIERVVLGGGYIESYDISTPNGKTVYLRNGSGVGPNTGRIKQVTLRDITMKMPNNGAASNSVVFLAGTAATPFDNVSMTNFLADGAKYGIDARFVTALKLNNPNYANNATANTTLTSTTLTTATYA